jgi:hypothetical protein
MYKVVPWSAELDLTEFYTTAAAKGFDNNSSQQKLVNCFDNENEKQIWILYYKDKPVGSVAAHSFSVMGNNSYRIAARTCVFTDQLDNSYNKALRTIKVITEHQNPTSQFLIPMCIEWAPKDANLYITTNENSVGTQKRVHRIFGPALEKKGLMKQVTTLEYRGVQQTVWQLFPDKFLEDLNRYPRWNLIK